MFFFILNTLRIGDLHRTRGSNVPGWLHMCRKTEVGTGKQHVTQFNLPHLVGLGKKKKDQESKMNLTMRLPYHKASKPSGYSSGRATMHAVEDHNNKKR